LKVYFSFGEDDTRFPLKIKPGLSRDQSKDFSIYFDGSLLVDVDAVLVSDFFSVVLLDVDDSSLEVDDFSSWLDLLLF
jgi:hypothetical protein